MPLFLKKTIDPEGVVGIWKVEEDLSYFEDHVDLLDGEEDEVANLNTHRRKEWFSSRYLLHLLSERTSRGACLKDEYGKPFLDNSEYFISMSHTADYVAVIGCPKVVGIDIQIIVPKIERIASKFISDREMHNLHLTNRLEMMHIYWGAKECLYKAYGKRGLDFKRDMFIDDFEYSADEVSFTGGVIKGNYKKEFRLIANTIDDFILVYAIDED